MITFFKKAIHVKILNINPSVSMPYQDCPKGAPQAKVGCCKVRFVTMDWFWEENNDQDYHSVYANLVFVRLNTH